ncbi:TIGR01621 family pseudouridine synthase [Catenovulum sp. 2E275]|uniref:TIGR01621 family pseudouridine synthase n=1 Tax=Catenovulum sp. 2E275 TaxID=2980497 RepID=UPI0021CEBFD1|nr:TIGR01621 family pseudouridine synthase [Catenovulum sp. 2E275]MCU4676963.1 TIGR01621 family pseudouridine synthase [Catenovulum sp. 2E275]
MSTEIDMKAINEPVEIVFTHADFYIVNKPHNVDFHDNQGETGFFNQFKQQTGESLYPVHRLDKATSGLIIFARNLAAEHFFNQALQQHQINKYYLAIGGHKPKQKQGRIIGDMEKSRNKAWKLSRTKLNPAKTFFYSFSVGDKKRLYLLKPYTGKTHQLRVAMKSISASIIGDDIYQGEKADRLYLHAFALSFNYQQTQISLISIPKQGDYFKQIPADLLTQVSQFNDFNWPIL